MATDSKKPKWAAVTFSQIERRRKELGYSKSAMATALGVTNSTFHNWQRGTTVPHQAQQDEIKSVLDKLVPGGASPAPKKPGRKSGASTSSGTGTRRKHSERSAGAGENVAGGSNAPATGFSMTHPHFPPSLASVPGRDTGSIATITSAYITSQSIKGPVSKDEVLDFISGLQEALYPTSTPKAEATEEPKVETVTA